MDRLLSYLTRNAWRRGLIGGNRVWVVAGAAAVLVRLVRRDGRARVVFREELQPGEAVVISHLAPETPPGGS
ncbi:MAG TPA: hypothetical protein VKI64_00385 [Acidimicrobiales bacterium]|nr:hypothetical protein [Acidimicrobiales bacterium]